MKNEIKEKVLKDQPNLYIYIRLEILFGKGGMYKIGDNWFAYPKIFHGSL